MALMPENKNTHAPQYVIHTNMDTCTHTNTVSGLAVVGRNRYGVFPLRGKVANPRDANHEQIMKNEEIKNLKTIREPPYTYGYLFS